MFVEDEAKRQGKTYSEVFSEYMPTAVRLMCGVVEEARRLKMDIIWDQTSTTVASRVRKFKMLPTYEHIAVVFQTPHVDVLTQRLAGRPGKEIPWAVIAGMIDNWEDPSEEEGFKEIWRAS
jgi:hypothetical protein